MKFIGLDIGTTTLTGVVYDLEYKSVSHMISEDNSFFRPQSSPDWERLQDPQTILDQAEGMLDQLMKWEPDVHGIGLTGQMHGIVYTDREGKHVSPLYTWQDGRGNLELDPTCSYAEWLSEQTGYEVASGYGLATHFYNLRHHLVPPEAASLCTIADYVAMRLCGVNKPLIDATQAAGMGCYSFALNDFDKETLAGAGLQPQYLPQVVPSGTIIGQTPTGLSVCTSLGDNQSSFLGSVPQPQNSLLLNIGTGSQVSALLPEACPEIEGMEARPFPGGGILTVGAALSGGKSYAVLEGFFRQVIEAYTGEEAGDIYPLMNQLLVNEQSGGRGLTVNPQFLGSRQNPGARGSIEGITPENFTPGNLTHSFLQGMLDELLVFYMKLQQQQTAQPFQYLIGSGNALRTNPVLCAKAQTVFGLPMRLSAAPEEAAVGAALCAAVGSGAIYSFQEAAAFVATVEAPEKADSSKDGLGTDCSYSAANKGPGEDSDEEQLQLTAEKRNELIVR
ncbi:hypothetical protein J7E73_32380 [Paenibacillus albidus]|uniref:sedoheptulokinase n=1 Tax=Paenibacillus albidus TaxID=2041023 RepID=UPI001BE9C756|nr:FGGY family carbohydrate kinase [Paenibacillus albidus]MBT2293709.1 hypothetical protein [Paenibacillus albidus]